MGTVWAFQERNTSHYHTSVRLRGRVLANRAVQTPIPVVTGGATEAFVGKERFFFQLIDIYLRLERLHLLLFLANNLIRKRPQGKKKTGGLFFLSPTNPLAEDRRAPHAPSHTPLSDRAPRLPPRLPQPSDMSSTAPFAQFTRDAAAAASRENAGAKSEGHPSPVVFAPSFPMVSDVADSCALLHEICCIEGPAVPGVAGWRELSASCGDVIVREFLLVVSSFCSSFFPLAIQPTMAAASSLLIVRESVMLCGSVHACRVCGCCLRADLAVLG
jgi:hypothetical protein